MLGKTTLGYAKFHPRDRRESINGQSFPAGGFETHPYESNLVAIMRLVVAK